LIAVKTNPKTPATTPQKDNQKVALKILASIIKVNIKYLLRLNGTRRPAQVFIISKSKL
jgi:hypothetical protein